VTVARPVSYGVLQRRRVRAFVNCQAQVLHRPHVSASDRDRSRAGCFCPGGLSAQRSARSYGTVLYFYAPERRRRRQETLALRCADPSSSSSSEPVSGLDGIGRLPEPAGTRCWRSSSGAARRDATRRDATAPSLVLR